MSLFPANNSMFGFLQSFMSGSIASRLGQSVAKSESAATTQEAATTRRSEPVKDEYVSSASSTPASETNTVDEYIPSTKPEESTTTNTEDSADTKDAETPEETAIKKFNEFVMNKYGNNSAELLVYSGSAKVGEKANVITSASKELTESQRNALDQANLNMAMLNWSESAQSGTGGGALTAGVAATE